MEAWFGRWGQVVEDLKSYQVAWAVSYMVAEGNVRMLEYVYAGSNLPGSFLEAS